ncbi:MAG: rRNA maturation RNase YbeY [Desulfovibrionaceae bacterium]|nr:rRNA maturation RNase YbeY [Desulfovibrionaceae bacterium]MBF0514887.1 rRNA maturation RNase YbeY [Desulfovibrionaceae bacterium]
MRQKNFSIRTKAALCPALPLSRGELSGLCARLCAALDLGRAAFELVIVDDAAIAALNLRFGGVDAPTNVLSFPGRRPGEPEYIGEIALSAPAAYREAALYGQDPAEHLSRLIAHGLLHLAGFDHGEVMETKTERAVRAARAAAPH